MRRFAAGNRLEKPTIAVCSNCNELTRPHRVCTSCGFYEGKSVLPGRKQAQVGAQA